MRRIQNNISNLDSNLYTQPDGKTLQLAYRGHSDYASTYAVSRQFTPESGSSDSPSDEAILKEALAFTDHIAPRTTRIVPLNGPIAIPQTEHGLGNSFLRAWAPILQDQDITEAEFLEFIDHLNVVSTANPPLQVLDVVGGVIGLVPSLWVQLAGGLAQLAAKVGTVAVSKGRSDMYLKEVNEKMFKPRGLKVSIAKTDAMRYTLRIPTSNPILAPLEGGNLAISTAERALKAIHLYNTPLELNTLPPPTAQTTWLAKMSAKQVKKKEQKTEEKTIKKREKALKKIGKTERKAEKRARKQERKHERKHGKHHSSDNNSDSDPDSSEDEGHTQVTTQGQVNGGDLGVTRKKDKQTKEDKNSEKFLWLLIENV